MQRSKLNLVDLAGSERMGKTGTQGITAKEAVHINKSLSFLEQVQHPLSCSRSWCMLRNGREAYADVPSVPGQVVLALSRRGSAGHVPYRCSKLTHYLKDAIGGNCCMRLIACIWSAVRTLLACIIRKAPGGAVACGVTAFLFLKCKGKALIIFTAKCQAST